MRDMIALDNACSLESRLSHGRHNDSDGSREFTNVEAVGREMPSGKQHHKSVVHETYRVWKQNTANHDIAILDIRFAACTGPKGVGPFVRMCLPNPLYSTLSSIYRFLNPKKGLLRYEIISKTSGT